MIVVTVFFRDWLLLFVLLFLFLQNIFVRVPIFMDHPHTEVVNVPFEKKHLLNDFFNLLYLKLWSENIF